MGLEGDKGRLRDKGDDGDNKGDDGDDKGDNRDY